MLVCHGAFDNQCLGTRADLFMHAEIHTIKKKQTKIRTRLGKKTENTNISAPKF